MAFQTWGDIGRVRFLIGDDTPDAGVLPSGANFGDTAINDRLSETGGNVYAAAAELCRSLARRWATAPSSFSADGVSVSRAGADKWLALAADLDLQAAAASGGSAGSLALDRRDAFSVALGASGEDTGRDYA